MKNTENDVFGDTRGLPMAESLRIFRFLTVVLVVSVIFVVRNHALRRLISLKLSEMSQNVSKSVKSRKLSFLLWAKQ